MKRFAWLVLGGLAVAGVAACGGGPKPQTPAPQPNADSAAAAEQARRDSIERARQDSIARAMAEAVRTLLATLIHFDFDKANIRAEDAAVLDQKIAILQANPNLRIRISGHCDERGSDEYNLALGNRRATSAKQYLVSHGIDGGRIETVSYGEERPLAPGHDEAAWAQNRRDEFEIISGGEALRQP